MLSIAQSTWKATKNVMHISTEERVASMNKFVTSAKNPPRSYIIPIKNGVVVSSNSSGWVFR